jgi:hypothetical protein
VSTWVKKVLWAFALAFALFYLLTRPEATAEALRGAGSAVTDAFGQVGQFFDTLF